MLFFSTLFFFLVMHYSNKEKYSLLRKYHKIMVFNFYINNAIASYSHKDYVLQCFVIENLHPAIERTAASSHCTKVGQYFSFFLRCLFLYRESKFVALKTNFWRKFISKSKNSSTVNCSKMFIFKHAIIMN